MYLPMNVDEARRNRYRLRSRLLVSYFADAPGGFAAAALDGI
jgi:hypothetical protein